MLAPFHSIRAHWRAFLAVIGFAVLVWYCLPAALRAKLSEDWKKFGHALGNFQARVLLTFIYGILILPFGLMVRFFADSLHIKKRPEQWLDHPPMPNEINEARRQG